MSGLVPRSAGPGAVEPGFAEQVLERATTASPPELWDGATTAAALAQKWNGFPAEKAEMKTAQMYCEVELGQRLGPRPGREEREHDESGQFLPVSHPIVVEIPQPRASEMQRYYGHRDMLIGLIREGARSRNKLLLAVDKARRR